ncbi:XkdX family protein [Tumebacillus lipolyticus]|uniref:XkdX family protein n=1 Tax=Tumebacillus lipolyticus TaxID=1280370 RepID=A0ABW5A0Q8_9BACL
MNDYEFWKMCFKEQWATESDMKQAVELGQLTEDEFEQIVGLEPSLHSVLPSEPIT